MKVSFRKKDPLNVRLTTSEPQRKSLFESFLGRFSAIRLNVVAGYYSRMNAF